MRLAVRHVVVLSVTGYLPHASRWCSVAKSRAARIARAIDKYGTTITLQYQPVANDAVSDGYGDDWPSPTAAPTTAALSSKIVKAIIVPSEDDEWSHVSNVGLLPMEVDSAYFKYSEDLNNVKQVVWRGNTYKVLQQDQYELSGKIIVQQVTISRIGAGVLYPHG